MKKTVALFDFDGTLIKGDSFPRFLWHCSTPLEFIRKSFFLTPVLIKYAFGMLDSQIAKERVCMCFFKGVNIETFMRSAKSFSSIVIPSIVRNKAIQRLKWHQEQQHDCILVSASLKEYLIHWGKSIGFSMVLASELEIDNNSHVTGRISGKNCTGAEKVSQIRKHLGDLKQYEIYAYGDSRGDRELLEIADHPYYKSFLRQKEYPHIQGS